MYIFIEIAYIFMHRCGEKSEVNLYVTDVCFNGVSEIKTAVKTTFLDRFHRNNLHSIRMNSFSARFQNYSTVGLVVSGKSGDIII